MSNDLSIGVMMPTLNCAALMPAHIESAREWLDLATEVVVVDSDSTDGTIAYLKENLRHPNLRVLRHPRGLYQSWNHGIGNVTQKYTYISTIGDSITRAGLLRLREVAETQPFDAVVSKPRFVDNEGRPLPDLSWPVDGVLEHFPGRELVTLEGPVFHYFAVMDPRGALFGSSASNLYLTRTLQEKPFPTGFGTTGDQAWAIAHALESRIAILAERFSTFRFHPKAYPASEYDVPDMRDKQINLARETLAARCAQAPEVKDAARRFGIERFLHLSNAQRSAEVRLDACRHSRWPWYFNPAGWLARMQRQSSKRELAALSAAAIRELHAIQPSPAPAPAFRGEANKDNRALSRTCLHR